MRKIRATISMNPGLRWKGQSEIVSAKQHRGKLNGQQKLHYRRSEQCGFTSMRALQVLIPSSTIATNSIQTFLTFWALWMRTDAYRTSSSIPVQVRSGIQISISTEGSRSNGWKSNLQWSRTFRLRKRHFRRYGGPSELPRAAPNVNSRSGTGSDKLAVKLRLAAKPRGPIRDKPLARSGEIYGESCD